MGRQHKVEAETKFWKRVGFEKTSYERNDGLFLSIVALDVYVLLTRDTVVQSQISDPSQQLYRQY